MLGIIICSLDNNNLTSAGVAALFNALKAIESKINALEVHTNQHLDDECMKALGEYIKSNKSIEEIRFSTLRVSDKNIAILAPYFEGNTTFKTLYLSGNKEITNKSIPFIVKMIESSTMDQLNVDGTSISKLSEINIALAQNVIRHGLEKIEMAYKSVMFYL